MTFSFFLLLLYLMEHGDAGNGIPGLELLMPPSHVALSGDLHVQIVSSSFPPLLLQLSRLEGNLAQPLTTFSILPEASALARNSTIVKIPCGFFSKAGQYYILIKKRPIGPRNLTDTDSKYQEDLIITRALDVRWPLPRLSLTPENIQTYPQQPVKAILEFPEVVCPPVADSPVRAIPEFWLELRYCGHSLLNCDTKPTDDRNKTISQELYSEQVRGFPGRRVLTLRCELFGLAGHYALVLRPTNPSPTLPQTVAYVKVDWSEEFVFNVHARSIFPCDVHNGGVQVLFQYPSCILSNGDRVRLFARLRANVASLAPPTSLEYIAEKRVVRGQHSLHFDCELFTEHYVEYCFVYVSQALSGAVADVRVDCVPTLPVTDQESGGWGPWSGWTPCSSTCIGGTRSRYRFCDSPPPRYGAKFCQGQAVETQQCGTGLGNSWECLNGSHGGLGFIGELAAEIPEVAAEVGPYCRCGCVVHLGRAKPKRLLATSSQSCPGRTFWLIQADEDHVVQFRVEQFHLMCGTQWLKVRDGSTLSSNLLADISGERDLMPSILNSTGPNLLLEFFSDDVVSGEHMCKGGFFAYATQIKNFKTNITAIPIAQSVGVVPKLVLKFTAVHVAALFFLAGLLLATFLLGAQYIFRYRKYHVAEGDDLDSLSDPGSSASLPLATRAQSSVTLLSEVFLLAKLRPLKSPRNKHVRLRESTDCEAVYQNEVTLAREEESLSLSSTVTLTQAEASTVAQTSETELNSSLPCSPDTTEGKATLKRSLTMSSEKDMSNEKDSTMDKRRMSNTSNITLTNVSLKSEIHSKSDPGCYSSAASMVSRATIRSTNAKETKDKRNREKLLAGPTGSEFSMSAQDIDLEMDYYDYNVVNAGAAPGSYLGMDPAFLIWIPPLYESEDLPEGYEYHEMEDISQKAFIDPGSNTESPEEEKLLPKTRKRSFSEGNPKLSPVLNKKNKRINPLEGIDNKLISEIRPLVHQNKIKILKTDTEKETKVEKSPSLEGEYVDDIKFADEEEEDLVENQCNMNVAYQDSNILSSN